MLLFHGSDRIIERPEFNKGNLHNDYGSGFYLTPDRKSAELWASKNNSGGFCMTYEVKTDKLNICHLEDATEENILSWITMLVSHRFSFDEYQNNKQAIDWLKSNVQLPLLDKDMIIGYRADDSYFAYSRDFVSDKLSIEALGNAMHLGKLGLQYVLVSEHAFSPKVIELKDYDRIEPSNEYSHFISKMNLEYQSIKSADNINNTFIRDIMRRGQG